MGGPVVCTWREQLKLKRRERVRVSVRNGVSVDVHPSHLLAHHSSHLSQHCNTLMNTLSSLARTLDRRAHTRPSVGTREVATYLQAQSKHRATVDTASATKS